MSRDSEHVRPLARMLKAIFYEYGSSWHDTTLAQFAWFITFSTPKKVFADGTFDNATARRYERGFLAQTPIDETSTSSIVNTHTVRLRLETSASFLIGTSERFGRLFEWMDTVSSF